jgi:glycosyltransferase involved in cell wall biosynthesis
VNDRLRILALEPYYGGSHRAVLDGLAKRIDAEWTMLTLPARKWKWRMRGAAISMAAEAREVAAANVGGASAGRTGAPWDLVFASTFVNLAEFRGMAGPQIASVPAIVYFHENQLLYPNRHSAEWDYQFPLTNITSALSAEACVFNTSYNLEGFVGEIPGFIREFPDHQPEGLAEAIRAKSRVLAPPFDSSKFDAVLAQDGGPHRGLVCRIVWPHRWEHDKDPEEFFRAVSTLAEEGLDFEVVVVGQSFRETEGLMRDAARTLGARLAHCDEPATRAEYARLLAGADVAVSTARNEFFGLAMVEACYAGCAPLVPNRLAYPELYPDEFRYASSDELVARLRGHVTHRPPAGLARGLAERFTFERLVPEYENLYDEVATGRFSAT